MEKLEKGFKKLAADKKLVVLTEAAKEAAKEAARAQKARRLTHMQIKANQEQYRSILLQS